LNDERKEYITQLKEMSFQLGEAQAKLQMIEAPRARPEERNHEPQQVERVSDAVEVQSEPAPAPTPPQAPTAVEPAPAPQAAEQKPGFFKRLLGR
jgi:hypothetical protein